MDTSGSGNIPKHLVPHAKRCHYFTSCIFYIMFLCEWGVWDSFFMLQRSIRGCKADGHGSAGGGALRSPLSDCFASSLILCVQLCFHHSERRQMQVEMPARDRLSLDKHPAGGNRSRRSGVKPSASLAGSSRKCIRPPSTTRRHHRWILFHFHR